MTARVGQPFAVVLRLIQGRAGFLRLWLTDGATELTITGPTAFATMTVYPVARTAGRFGLTLSGVGVCGEFTRTGLVRTVTVSP